MDKATNIIALATTITMATTTMATVTVVVSGVVRYELWPVINFIVIVKRHSDSSSLCLSVSLSCFLSTGLFPNNKLHASTTATNQQTANN